MELHDRLKAAREDADLTQAQVAEQTGIARRQYIRYEQGAQEMGIAKLRARCQRGLSPWLAPGAELAPLTRGMLFRGGPLLRGRAGWLFMPCGHTKKGRNTPPLFWVQYLN